MTMKLDPIDLYMLTTYSGKVRAVEWLKLSEVMERCRQQYLLFAKAPYRQKRGRHRRFGMSRRQRLALNLAD